MSKTFRTQKALGDQFDVDKFGRAEAVVATDDIWALSRIHVKPAAAATLYISSSDEANDNDIYITVEYIDANGAQKSVIKQLDSVDARVFVSLEVTGLRQLVKSSKEIESSLGDGSFGLNEGELVTKESLRK